MSKPCIICVAITGSVPTRADNPAVPTTISEQVESTHAAYEAGASICHAHVRNDDQTPSSDPEKFARLKEGVERHCPGMIVQFSTGGRSGAGKERGGMLPLGPDMASLTVGSNNFPTRVYENPPDLVDWLASEMVTYDILPEIEAFDLSHIHQTALMHADGRLPKTPYVQFVMGVKNAMPADKDVFDYYVRTSKATCSTRSPPFWFLAAGVGFLGLMLRQPLIVSFIAVGIIAGPSVLDIARSDEQIDLWPNWASRCCCSWWASSSTSTGAHAWAGGAGDRAGPGGLHHGLRLPDRAGARADARTALYVAIALTFSSTIIIVKLLSDKREIDSLHGRIALGFLIVQDIVVVIAMIVLSAIGVGGAAAMMRVRRRGARAGLRAGDAGLRRAVHPLRGQPAGRTACRGRRNCWSPSPSAGRRLLAAVGHYLGFGKELGGLLAGVSLASTPFREAIAARLASLRDFLLLFFFIALGASLDLSVLGASVGPAIVLSLFVLIGNPLIVLAIMGAMGYRKRTGFLAGLTVAQISEFSLIFMAMGSPSAMSPTRRWGW
jgi:hypothetical protein